MIRRRRNVGALGGLPGLPGLTPNPNVQTRKKVGHQDAPTNHRLVSMPSTILEEYKTEDIRIETNAKVIEENLQRIFEETIQHNVDMMIVTCGYILSPYFR